jgi:hypothetical protein
MYVVPCPVTEAQCKERQEICQDLILSADVLLIAIVSHTMNSFSWELSYIRNNISKQYVVCENQSARSSHRLTHQMNEKAQFQAALRQECTNFQKCNSHPKTQCPRKVTQSNLHMEDTHILGATM